MHAMDSMHAMHAMHAMRAMLAMHVMTLVTLDCPVTRLHVVAQSPSSELSRSCWRGIGNTKSSPGAEKSLLELP